MVLEGKSNRISDEQPPSQWFELNASIHVDGLVHGLNVTPDVDHRKKALDADVESHRPVRRGGTVRQIGSVALNDNTLQQVWEGSRHRIENLISLWIKTERDA